ncbi:MAG: hypothetical protein RR630_01925 [Coprobacillus sp.]
MLYLKIKKDNHLTKYISILRKYNKSLSFLEIKKSIDNNEFVIEHDLNSSFDITDDLNDINRNILFHDLITKLLNEQAQLELFQDGYLINVEILDNLIERTKQIEEETILDIDRELGES